MRLSEDFLLNIKESNDIYDVISSYVPLKKSGTDYVCNCPFHSEKTPSCHIYMATQSFYCFGCGAAGDVINFIRLYEHLDYMESVKFLAQRAGIAMPDEEGDNGIKRRTRAYEMNREAGRFFHKYLYSPAGKEGLDYLYGRGLTDHTIRTYGLGYAPDTWDSLKKHMNSLGYSDSEMEEASLLSKSSKSGNYFDFFKYRVMFPFIDVRGNIVGFSGRVIGGEDNRKYLNTKATAVYNKSTFLYSLNHAKNAGGSSLIMCEGNLDVIAMFQAGFKNAVATCGTAITDAHARTIANLGFKKVILAYDSDDAGQKATARAMNILDKVGITANVLTIQGAKDPDEYIKNFGKEAFELLIGNSESGMEYELKKLRSSVDLTTPEGKSEYLKKAVDFISNINSSIDRAVYISTIAQECNVNRSNVDLAVNQILRRRYKAKENDRRREIIGGTRSRDKINPDAMRYPVETQAERGIIAFLFHSPDFLKKITDKISSDDFVTDFNKRLFIDLTAMISCGLSNDVAVLSERYTAEEVASIYKLIHDNSDLPYNVDRLNDYLNVLIKYRDKKQTKKVTDMSADELRQFADKIKNKKS